MVRAKPCEEQRVPGTDRRIKGMEAELLSTQMSIMKNELRIRLLRSLLKQGLATRDVFYFAKGQAELRQYNKETDHRTIRSPMEAKIIDMKKILHMDFRKRDGIKNILLSEFDNKTESMGKLLRRIKREVN